MAVHDRSGIGSTLPDWPAIGYLGDQDGIPAALFNPVTRQVGARLEDALPSGTAAWSKDERLFANLRRNEVVVIDAHTGAIVCRFPQNSEHYPLSAAFSSDASMLAVSRAEGGGVVVYDLKTGSTLFSQAVEGWTFGIAFSPDGKNLSWATPTHVQTADVGTWTASKLCDIERPTSVEPGMMSYAPDGRSLAVACGLIVPIIDVHTRTVRATLRGHAQRVHSLSFDASGRRLVTTSVDRTVRTWNVATGLTELTLLGHEAPTWDARFLETLGPGGADVISVDSANRIRTWSTSTNGPTFSNRFVERGPHVSQLDFSADGGTLRAAIPQSLATIDLLAGPRVESRGVSASDFQSVVPGQPLRVRTEPGTKLTLESTVDGTIRWSIDTQLPGWTIMSPDGSKFAVVLPGWRLSSRRVSDGGELCGITTNGSGLHRPAFSPDGQTLATSQYNGQVRLWNADTGTAIAELQPAIGDCGHGLDWSDDGSLLAYGEGPERVVVIDVRTREPLTRIRNIGGTVWSIAISPDHTRLVVGSQDRITHLFELPSGEELLQLRDHTGTVMVVKWSPDGSRLATGGYDKRVFVHSPPASNQ